MQDQPYPQPQIAFSQMTRQGKPIRLMTLYEPSRITEWFYQQFGDVWVPYKRIVITTH